MDFGSGESELPILQFQKKHSIGFNLNICLFKAEEFEILLFSIFFLANSSALYFLSQKVSVFLREE